MRSLREAAEAQIIGLLQKAEIEAARITDQSRAEGQQIVQRAVEEAIRSREEATAIRQAADERLKEIERLEADFNRFANEIASRLDIKDTPSGGWWKRLGRSKR